jgi:Zn-dependent protease with chaperone function
MYTDIFLFIIAFSIFSLYVPQQPSVFTVPQILACCLLVIAVLYLYCRTVFNRLTAQIERDGIGASDSARHAAMLNTAKIAALFAYAALILIFDLKQALPPVFMRSEFLLSLFGSSAFITLLLIVWRVSFPSYRRCCDPHMSLNNYIFWHLRMSCSLLLPWLILAAFMDCLSFLQSATYDMIRDNLFVSGALFAGFMCIIVVFFPLAVIRLWGCSKLPAGPERQLIEEVCNRARVRCSGMYVWNLFGGHLLSAGILGFVPVFRYLLITPSLLKLLDRDELEAVVAHEAGHVRHRHMLFSLFFILGFGLLYVFFYTHVFGILITNDVFLDLTVRKDGTLGILYHIVPIGIIVAMILLYFRFLFGFVLRSFERQADLAAVSISGSSAGIIGALEKIAMHGSQSRIAPSWHHYSIAERIAYLRSSEGNPVVAMCHRRTVRMITWSYCILLLVFGAFLYGNSEALQERENWYTFILVEKMSQRLPDNAVLHFQLAGLYYEKKLFSAAEKEYRWAIELRPDFYEACNNLAWLYATCEDHSVRNYPEALRLARMAVSLANLPYILDTLAECLYVNGLYRQAVIAAEEALYAADPQEREHYEKQLDKYRAAYGAQHTPVLYDNGSTIAL